MEKYKSLDKFYGKKKLKKELKIVKYVKGFMIKSMVCFIIFLSVLIVIKSNSNFKATIYKYVYSDNLSFAKINSLYKKYLGGILPFDTIAPDTELVFKEDLKYSEDSLYKDGVKLTVINNYLTPVIESGIVVFIGEKENYGKTIIVQGVNGVDIWYGNVANTDIKLYDYVEKGSMLGEVNGNNLYLVFQKEGKFLNYKDYI